MKTFIASKLDWMPIVFIALTVVYSGGVDAQSFSTLFQRQSRNSILFPKIRCALALYMAKFNISNFEMYPEYFRDDSVMQLAQAGSYKGAENIEEYVKFAFPAFSPYLNETDKSNDTSKTEFLGYNNGNCEALILFKNRFFFNPDTTDSPPQFDGVFMLKLFFDFKNRYVKRINVFYTEDFLRVFFDVALNSDNTRRFVCKDVIEGPCSSIVNATNSCEDTLISLPTADAPSNYVDGYSQGCRALHSVFASTNPINHCAHLSFTPIVDPSGYIKCQNSSLTPPTDLFTDEDLNKLSDFAASFGMDPVLGHNSGA